MFRAVTSGLRFDNLRGDFCGGVTVAVEEVIERALAGQRRVLMIGLKPRVEQVLTKLGVMELIGRDARFRDRLSALQYAASTVKDPDEASSPGD